MLPSDYKYLYTLYSRSKEIPYTFIILHRKYIQLFNLFDIEQTFK